MHMSPLGLRLRLWLTGALNRRRAQRATLPWDELEAEAARQRCSPADIFFDRAGLGDPSLVEGSVAAPSAPTAEAGGWQDEGPRVRWRGLDPRPAARTADPSA
jgi:hypothetical protein